MIRLLQSPCCGRSHLTELLSSACVMCLRQDPIKGRTHKPIPFPTPTHTSYFLFPKNFASMWLLNKVNKLNTNAGNCLAMKWKPRGWGELRAELLLLAPVTSFGTQPATHLNNKHRNIFIGLDTTRQLSNP